MAFFNDPPFEWTIGLRYTRASRRSARNSFISFISLISMAGIALGVAALIVVLSVMNGFQKEVRDRMLSVLSHVEVFDGSGSLPDWQDTAAQALRHPQVRGAAPFVDGQAMVTRNDTVRGVVVRGILPAEEPKVSAVASQVVQGSLQSLAPGEFNIVVGSALARSLGLHIGDKLTLIAPQGQVTPAGVLPRLKQFNVTGIFEAGHYEFDSSLAFIHLEDGERMFRLAGPSGLRLKLADMQRAPEVAGELAAVLPIRRLREAAPLHTEPAATVSPSRMTVACCWCTSESFERVRAARYSCTMPMRELATITKPKSESWNGATNHMTTHMEPMRPLNHVRVFERMMLARLRLRGSGASLVCPRATRSATCSDVSPVSASV